MPSEENENLQVFIPLPSSSEIGVWMAYLNRVENNFLRLVALVPALLMVILLLVRWRVPTGASWEAWIVLELFFGGMVAALLLPRALHKKRSRTALLHTLTQCEKEQIETICRIGTTHDAPVRKAAEVRLLTVLPEISEGDEISLGRFSRSRLHRILKSKEPEEVRSVLAALEWIGEGADSEAMEALASGKHAALFCPDIQQYAARLLPVLRWREANLKHSSTLLRPSASEDSLNILLRPASELSEDPQTLLRPGNSNPSA